MNTDSSMRSSCEGLDDSQLVVRSLNGDTHAYEQIVLRYQNLVCSLAYSLTGSLSRSEDLAQEVFVSAWKQLKQLKAPDQLRSWLCGITRNMAHHARRKEAREAEVYQIADPGFTTEANPHEALVSREEEQMVWRVVGSIPEAYREPMILYYRELESVATVAQLLGVTEEVVRQRLSRGRKLLRDRLTGTVEGALRRSAPGKAFAWGVISSLPVFAGSASAASAGMTAAAQAGGTAGKAIAAWGGVGAILGPILGLLGGIFGTAMSIQNTRSHRERRFVVVGSVFFWILALGFCAVQFFVVREATERIQVEPIRWISALVGVPLGYALILVASIFWFNRRQRAIRADETASPNRKGNMPGSPNPPGNEYQSKWMPCGLPFIHVCMKRDESGRTVPAKGWIAIGDVAYGVLFAFGGIAAGGIAMGGLAVGLVSIGGFAIGGLSLAGLALGGYAMGGAAIGWMAFGGAALGWTAAAGGIGVSLEAVLQGSANAVGNKAGLDTDIFREHWLFRYGLVAMRNAIYLVWLPVILLFWHGVQYLNKQRQTRS